MTIPILRRDPVGMDIQNIAVVFSDTEGNCRMIETTDKEKRSILSKMASNRSYQSKNYVGPEVAIIPVAISDKISALLTSLCASDNAEAKAIMDLLTPSENEPKPVP